MNLLWRDTFDDRPREVSAMSCNSCHPAKRRFTAEVCIHLPGLENLDTPTVLVFPSLDVCLDCGIAEFAIDREELQKLQNSHSTNHQPRGIP